MIGVKELTQVELDFECDEGTYVLTKGNHLSAPRLPNCGVTDGAVLAESAAEERLMLTF